MNNKYVALVCVLGLLAGGAIGFYTDFSVPAVISVYIAIGILVAVDSVFGAVWADLNKKFSVKELIWGITVNSLVAVILIILGSKLGLDLYLPVEFVFCLRIFEKISKIRTFLLNK